MTASPRAIRRLISGGESETLEFKKSTGELKEAVVSAASILNKHHGGELYFGIKNDGTVTGQAVSGQTLRDVSRALAEHIEPRVYPHVNVIKLSGKDCIQVRFSGAEIPYLAYGRGYIRIGDEDRQLSAKELERMILRRTRDANRWEDEPSDKRSADANVSLRSFMREANAAGRIDFKFSGAAATLNKLGLLRHGRLLKAGQVLFCRDNPLEVQAAIFAGTDKTTFLDIKQFEGNIFDLLKKSETYLKQHLDWRVKFGGLERQEIPEIPIDALREALVNSLCHRDFRNPKGNEVAIFKDRVEIYNPGDFPEGYQPQDFIKGEERSILRNPRIAGVLFKSKDIEKWGSGLKRIARECARNAVRVNFKVLKSGFLVVFHRVPAGALTHSTVGKTVGKTTDRIITLIKTTPRITREQLARQTGLSVRGIEWNLEQLRARGEIRRIGSRKFGRWEVVT
ncbi:MAG: ATP-binding protein [Elusimicrobia bacterium]|nr:ATP-binding protein [Elusimicrobiota bacterium]